MVRIRKNMHWLRRTSRQQRSATVSCTVDGTVYAQPLWIPKVSIGGGTHNVIVAVSMRDSVYVFDADAIRVSHIGPNNFSRAARHGQ